MAALTEEQLLDLTEVLQRLNHGLMPGSAASLGVASTATHRGERVDDEKNDEENEATDQATDQEQPNKRRRVHILDDAEKDTTADAAAKLRVVGVGGAHLLCQSGGHGDPPGAESLHRGQCAYPCGEPAPLLRGELR